MEQPVAIITGAGQGIGRVTALHLAGRQYRVALFETDAAAGKEHEDSIKAGIRAVIDRWNRIDALLNNAGFMIRKPLEKLTLKEWNQVIGTNLTGAFLCAKYATPHLRERRGSIVNMSSTRRLMSETDTESYSASKGGLFALTHALAISLGPDIRVNSVSPGWIDVTPWQKESEREPADLSAEDHEQHPVGRVGMPQDIAEMVEYLLSAKSGFITGQDFIVDGGVTRKMIYV